MCNHLEFELVFKGYLGPAAVAQLVERASKDPGLVQLYWREIESRHKVVGNKSQQRHLLKIEISEVFGNQKMKKKSKQVVFHSPGGSTCHRRYRLFRAIPNIFLYLEKVVPSILARVQGFRLVAKIRVDVSTWIFIYKLTSIHWIVAHLKNESQL